jgi:tetratricopeptide (TPR) repeat protein
MKRLLTLTFCLLTTGSAFNVLADQCDNLRNNQQAYRDCVNDWYGRSNRGSAPTPWWKNYDPNAGSSSAPAEAPTLSKQQQIDLQLQRERQQREAERQAAEERRAQQEAETNLEAARKRASLLTQRGIDALSAGKPEEALGVFYAVLDTMKGHESWRFNYRTYPQLYDGLGRASAQLQQFLEAEIWFQRGVAEFSREDIDDIKTGAFGRAYKALANFFEERGRLDDALEIHSRRFNKTRWLVSERHPEAIAAALDYVRVKEKRDAARKHTDSQGSLLAQADRHIHAMNESLNQENYQLALKACDDALTWATEKNDAGLSTFAQRNKAKALMKLNRGGEASELLTALLATLDKTPPPLNRNDGFGDKQSVLYEVLGGIADGYELRGLHGYAEPYRHRMLEIQEKTRGPEHLETLAALRALADNLSRFDKYTAAVPVRQRAVAVAEKLPDAQSQLPELRKNLLSEYRSAGGFEQEANALEEQIDWRAAWSRLAQAANDSYKARQYEEAIKQGQSVLEFAQKHGDSKEWRVATSQNNLAVYYWVAQKYAQAEVYYKKALESHANSKGTDSPALIAPLHDLGSVYELLARYNEAEVLYKRGLALAEKDKDSTQIASTLRENLAALQQKLAAEQKGEWKTAWNSISEEAADLSAKPKISPALKKAREALALAEKHDGPKQYDVASSQYLLAQILWRNKQTDEAESLLKAAISTFERSSESKTLTGLAKVMTTLANLHEYQNRNAEAELLYKRVIALREKQADQNLSALIESLDNLAQHYFQRNHHSPDYAPLLRRLITLQEKQLGPEHLDVADTLDSLAHHLYIESKYSNAGHYKEAETHFKRALAILEKSPSAKTKRMQLKVLYGLRRVYSETNQEQAAEQIKQREKALEEQS